MRVAISIREPVAPPGARRGERACTASTNCTVRFPGRGGFADLPKWQLGICSVAADAKGDPIKREKKCKQAGGIWTMNEIPMGARPDPCRGCACATRTELLLITSPRSADRLDWYGGSLA